MVSSYHAISDQWSPQWICARCSRSVGLQDIPSRPTSHCPQCSDSNLTWIVLPTSRHSVPVASKEGLKSLIHHFLCPNLWVCQVGFPEAPSHMWGVFTDGEILPSLLLVVGLSHGSSVHSSPLLWSQLRSHVLCPVGQLDPVTLVPDPQREFWCSTALEIIHMFSVHVGLQHNWHGGEHLSGRLQELCSPPHIMSALCAWLVRQCDEFVSPTSGNVVVQTVCPVLRGRHQPFLSVPQRPFLVHQIQPILSLLQRSLLVHRNQPILSLLPPPGPSEPANPFTVAPSWSIGTSQSSQCCCSNSSPSAS